MRLILQTFCGLRLIPSRLSAVKVSSTGELTGLGKRILYNYPIWEAKRTLQTNQVRYSQNILSHATLPGPQRQIGPVFQPMSNVLEIKVSHNSYAINPRYNIIGQSLRQNGGSTQKRFYQHWFQPQNNGWNRWRYTFRRWLRELNSLSFTQVSYGLIAIFVAVFLLKSVLPWFPPLYYSRWTGWYTTFTSMFDHGSFSHLFSNSLFLFCLTSIFPYGITSVATIALFVSGGLMGLGASVVLAEYHKSKAFDNRNVMQYNFEQSMRYSGSSAGIYTLTVVQTLLNPHGSLSLYGIIPMRNWVFLAGVVCFDIFGALRSEMLFSKGAIPTDGAVTNHYAHLGSAVYGVFAYMFMIRFRKGLAYYY
ncbi:hypothetical protein V1511DRAFT_492978 [Dipodascopsis uninucleata]